jgi:hypothetical protein
MCRQFFGGFNKKYDNMTYFWIFGEFYTTMHPTKHPRRDRGQEKDPV